jgi:inhibitor of cysteine peptidase
MSPRNQHSLRLVFAPFLLLTLLLTSCGSSSEVELDLNDSGSQVELAKGQDLVIELESNPTTGYGWHVVEMDEAILKQIGEVEYTPSQTGEIVGAGGVEVLRFEAIEVGTTYLELGYLRVWEKDVEPLELFTLSVVVR